MCWARRDFGVWDVILLDDDRSSERLLTLLLNLFLLLEHGQRRGIADFFNAFLGLGEQMAIVQPPLLQVHLVRPMHQTVQPFYLFLEAL